MHIVLPIALITAALLGVLNVALALGVGRVRVSDKVLVGDGGNERLLQRIRAHGNLTEYAPSVVILIALLELAIGSPTWLAVVAGVFVLARVLHVVGMRGWRPGRMVGILVTWAILLGLALYALTLPLDIAPKGDGRQVETTPAA